MADSRKTGEGFDPASAAQGIGPSGESLKPGPVGEFDSADSASGEVADEPLSAVRVAGRRNWARLWRRLVPLLLGWVPALIAGAYFSLQPLGAGLPDPLGWALTPLSANSFSACRAEAGIEPAPVAPIAPSKASLLIPSAHAQEAAPNVAPNAAQDVEQQQVQQQQQQQQQQSPPQQQGPADSGSTGGGFSSPFDIASPVGCGELGFGDLADVAVDQSGQAAWVINRYGPLYHSADGGRTWEQQALPDLPAGVVLSAIAADDAGRQVVVAARDANFRFSFYRSDTGGQSWRAAPEMLLVEQKGGSPIREIGGLVIGAERAATQGNAGVFVVANIIGDGPEVLPAVWRDSAAAWTIGYDGLDAEMVHRLRGHDFGIFGLDLGATGPATPPIPSWERWQGDAALRYSLQTRDPMDPTGALTGDLTPTVEYMIGAGALRGLAASDDGQVAYGVETQAILRGDSRDESWTRITLPGAGADIALGAIDVANGSQTILAVGRNALFVSQDGGVSFFQPALSRYPAPWFYLLLLSGPLFAFFVVRPGAPETVVIDADESKGLSDRALGLKDADALNLRAYAEGLSNLLRNAETRPPLVVGITGPWGSGKSSVMQMLSELLGQRQMPVVWFNAWHHQSEEHLLASLLSNIRRQGIPGIFTRPGLRLRWRLTLQKLKPHEPIGSFLTSWLLLLLGVALLSGSLALWLAPPIPAGSIPEDGKAQAETASSTTETPAQSEARSAVAAIQGIFCDDNNKDCNQLIESGANLLLSLKLGAVFTLLLGLVPLSRLKQVALITRNFDPAKLMTSVLPASRNPKLDEQLSFRHGFGEELRATIAALAPYRLVIFIDDLDRCRPENVAAVLEAVNFVVSSADCYVVLGMDRAYVLRAIRQEFEKFIAMEREERVEPGLDSPEDDKGRPRDFAEHYLEKLVNLIVSVPKMTPEARSRLMDSLASRPARLEDPAPRFDWQAWLLRSTAVAAVLAALLGPALYVASFSPPVEQLPVQAQQGATNATAAQGGGAAPPQGEVRTVTPDVTESVAATARENLRTTGASPILLGLFGLLALAGIVWAAIRAVSVPPNLLVRDSKAFKSTLRVVEPGLASFLTTPRRAKRFVNRLRLFGAMLRSARHKLGTEREAALDRATVQAGALHALAREIWLARQAAAEAAGAPPSDPAARAAWDQLRKLAMDSQAAYRTALTGLYQAVDRTSRPLVDALYWRFWQISDGATLGDPVIVQLAATAEAAATGATSAGTAPAILRPGKTEDIEDLLP